jgi:regulator of sirC expression with transglutaminase-like and TPR domain
VTRISPTLVDEFTRAATLPHPGELAPAALTIARIAYPALDAAPYIERLDELGARVAARIAGDDAHGSLAVINQLLFDDLGFVGNRSRYHDPRNSFLNDVLDRRTGIPISLGTVYIEVARRIDLAVYGVNFPGHFLLTAPTASETIVLDPFDAGAVLSRSDCERLWHRYVPVECPFDRAALTPASKPEVLARMLQNLKRLFVELRAFQKAWAVAELLVALDPTALTEVRDRGLIAYQLRDFSAALRDLEAYLRLARVDAGDKAAKQEQGHVWEHVKALRRRVAGMN